MPRVFKQVSAEQDLIEIWLYTFSEWGAKQADKYIDDLAGAFNLLAAQPHQCRERGEFSPPVRIHHHGHHLIVYLAVADGVNIVRVLHESMDVDSRLEGPESANK